MDALQPVSPMAGEASQSSGTEQDLQLSGSHLLERNGGPAKVRDSMGQGVHVGWGPWSFR